jgi:hypothetical protein
VHVLESLFRMRRWRFSSSCSSRPRTVAWKNMGERCSWVLLTDIPKLFPGVAALLEKEPVELKVLAGQKLTGE